MTSSTITYLTKNTIARLFLLWLIALSFCALADHTDHKLDSLQKCLLRYGPDSNRAKVLINMAQYHSAKSNYACLKFAREAQRLSDSIGYKRGMALSTGMIGTSYESMGQYEKALFYYLQTLRMSEEMKDNRTKAITLNYIGNVYMWQKKNDLAWRYYLESLNLFIRIGLKTSFTVAYNNLGIIAYKQKKWDKSIGFYQKAIWWANACGTEMFLSAPYSNLGELYAELNMLDSAKYYYSQGLRYSTKSVNRVNCNSGLGKIYVKEGNYALARQYLLQSKDVADSTGELASLLDIYKSLALLYEKQKDYKQAYEYQQLLYAMSDSVYSEKTVNLINDFQGRYDMEKKDKEIRLLSQTRQTAEAQASSQKILRNFLIAAFGFVFIVSLVLVRNVVLKQKINKILLEKNLLIERDNTKLQEENVQAKYETLKSKINPHFLFNSLTTLSSIVMEDRELAIVYIERFSELYRMILETGEHKLVSLSQELDIVKNYLYLQNVRYDNDLILHVDVPRGTDGYYLPPFALQMIVENAIKHNMISEQYQLSVFIYTENEYIVVENSLQKRHNKPVSTGTGQKNIMERYRLLSERQPVFTESADRYIVKLPLIRQEQPIEEAVL